MKRRWTRRLFLQLALTGAGFALLPRWVLAAISKDVHFSPAERRLLAEFLEECDAIKFARVGADVSVNESLLERAFAFVRGGFVEGALA